MGAGLKGLSLLVFISCVAACSTVPPPPTGHFQSPASREETARIIWEAAQKCWKKAPTFTVNGVGLSNRLEIDGTVIYAYSVALHQAYPYFFKATIKEAPSGSLIEVAEGGMQRNSTWFTQDVSRWLRGDTSCSTLRY